MKLGRTLLHTGGQPTFSEGAHQSGAGAATDTDIQTPVAAPGQYLLNPEQMPSSRHHDSPVQTITKVILGRHGLLIGEENEVAACDELLTKMAAAISKQLHSSSFVSKHCISQMGNRKITMNEKVTEELESNLRTQISSAVDLADMWERGDLIERAKLTEHEKRAEATLLQATEKLAEMDKKLQASNVTSIDAIDKAMGDIYDAIERRDFEGKEEVLASINSKRLIVNPSVGIDYDKLRTVSSISSVADMQAATGAAMSPAKSQKYFDKCAEQMNELDVDAARAKLIKLHTKLIGSDAKYVPDAADDFPAAASDFKEKFGMSRIEFWKMKALEKRLSCPISPGEIINPESKIAHFTSLSPSPTKRLSFADETGDIGISTAVKSSEETSGDDCKVEDELYLPKNDKSFEKAVDWTKPETSKVTLRSD